MVSAIKKIFLINYQVYISQWNKNFMNYTFLMEIFILVILVLIVGFILFRPISKKELDRYNDKDNWSNMGF